MACRFRYDEGIQSDFDCMTDEAGREVTVQTRTEVLSHESQEAEGTAYTAGITETVSMQEMDSTHEQVQSGEFKVGDVKFTFKSDSIAEEEGRVIADGNTYKILKLTRTRGLVGNSILEIKSTGKKIDQR